MPTSSSPPYRPISSTWEIAADVLAGLRNGPATATELASLAGCGRVTAAEYVQRLRVILAPLGASISEDYLPGKGRQIQYTLHLPR